MALQVWLPLTRDLRNQGLKDVSAVVNGTTSFTAGKLGQALNCNGSSYWSLPGLTVGTVASIACWSKTSTNSKMQWVLESSVSNKLNLYESSIYTLNTGDGNNNPFQTDAGANINCLHDGKWHHFVVTWDGSTCKLYIDGAYKGRAKTYRSPASGNSTRALKIAGGYDNAHSYDWNGAINDFRLYDHCLSPMEVKELSKGLILHYPLNRGGWGQENLYGHGSDLQTTLKGLNNYNNSFNIIEEDGKKCAHVSGALSTTKYLQSKLTFTPTVMEQFTFSAEVKIKNIIRGTTNPMCEFYFSGVTLDGAWRGFTVEYIKVDGQKVGATAIGFDRYLTDTAWHKVAVTAHFNYNGTSTIPALYPNIYLRDCTGDLYIRNVKLEKGPVATPWCPNSSDNLADEMGLNSIIEYDTSGYCNNGEKIGTLTYTSDTPKYQVSTHIGATSQKIHISGLTTSGFGNSYSFAWWGKRTSNSPMFWGFSDGIRLNGMYIGTLWNTGDGSNNPLYKIGTTTQVTAPSVNEWHHYVMTGNGTKCYVYLDGELWAEAKTYKAISGTSIYINGWNSATDYCSNNTDISDFRIYATALSAADVKSLYQNCVTIDPDGTIRGKIR